MDKKRSKILSRSFNIRSQIITIIRQKLELVKIIQVLIIILIIKMKVKKIYYSKQLQNIIII